MREIKFRARRIDNGRWVYGQYFITPLTDENSGTTPDAGWFFLTGETRHCIVQNGVAFVIDLNTLGQYTGLHDKNGKEIYEGDIVESSHRIYDGGEIRRNVVEFNDFCWRLVAIGDGMVANAPIGLYARQSGAIMVIGNIYENPEIME